MTNEFKKEEIFAYGFCLYYLFLIFIICFMFVFFFKQKTAYEISACLVGSDISKAMETALLRQNIYTEYLEEVVCYSKKEESANGYEAQRLGWLRSQYSSALFAIKQLPLAMLRGEWDYCNKLFQWLLPSRFLLIALILFFTAVITIMDWTLCLSGICCLPLSR